MITEKRSEGTAIKSIKSLKLTRIIMEDKINLKYSPLKMFVYLEPIWTPTTEPNNNIVARTISTVWF